MNLITKEDLINALKDIRNKGWIPNARHGNAGGVGNTLEDLLGIEENNLPIPNAAEWELKCKRATSSSLTSLFHLEPSPRAVRFVPALFLPKYGWPHQQAGIRKPENEMSFRQTINSLSRTDRGFGVIVNRKLRKIIVSFDSRSVDARHSEWLQSVEKRVGMGELDPQPYWGFDDICHKAGTKLCNCFFIVADVKRIEGKEHFRYSKIMMLVRFLPEKFLDAIETGDILIDFDASTSHNHGTKFRLRHKNGFSSIYDKVTEI